MADKKITALTASTALSTDDLFHVVDSPASSPSNKKITANNVFQKVPTFIAHSDTPQTLTGAGAINSTTSITHLVTTGTDALTISDGTMTGQVKYIIMKTDGGMKDTFSRIAEAHPNSPLADRFGSSQTNQQKRVESIGKKHGLVRKDGGQDVSKLTNTYKTT